MLLVLALLLVLPAKRVEPAGCPLELSLVLWLVTPNIVFQPGDRVLFAPEALRYVGGIANRLIVGKFHYPARKSDIILLQVHIFDSLRVAQILELVGCARHESFLLRVAQHLMVVEWLEELL